MDEADFVPRRVDENIENAFSRTYNHFLRKVKKKDLKSDKDTDSDDDESDSILDILKDVYNKQNAEYQFDISAPLEGSGKSNEQIYQVKISKKLSKKEHNDIII